MAVSGTISETTFNTRRVIDNAFRRCRLPAQAITAEMQDYAKDALYLQLSELASPKTPSWCIEKLILPFELNNSTITLPVGTVDVLNVCYRVGQSIEPFLVTETATSHTEQFYSVTQVSTVGIGWLGTPEDVTIEHSDDNLTWTSVTTIPALGAVVGDIVWTDIVAPAALYFRVTATTALSAKIIFQNMAREIPLGSMNRDTYAAIPNKTFTSNQSVNYWFQRQRVNPILHIWPAPNQAALINQLVVWRHRHIMDVGTLAQEIEVPQRWMEAIIAGLASKLAYETPAVDLNLIPLLEQKAANAQQVAWNGDNDGSPTFITPYISYYTA